MKSILFFLIGFSFLAPLYASPIDTELQTYIQQFQLKAITPPKGSTNGMLNLGKKLFFDVALSGNRNISCAGCHHPLHGSGDGLILAIGEGGAGTGPSRQLAQGHFIRRHSPGLFNVGHPDYRFMFWDARVRYDAASKTFVTPEARINQRADISAVLRMAINPALAAQVLFPMLSNDEMRGHTNENDLSLLSDNFQVWDRINLRVIQNPQYHAYLALAYPTLQKNSISIFHLAVALADFITYQFSVVRTPYDDYLRGATKSLSENEKKGMSLFFGKARCGTCHNGELLTNLSFHSVAIPYIGLPGTDDRGLEEVTGNSNHRYRFKTPMLRNLRLTAPYMHNGTFATIRDVIRHYTFPFKRVKEFSWATSISAMTGIIVDQDSARNDLRYQTISPPIRMPMSITDEEEGLIELFLTRSLSEYPQSITD